ncbi:S-formylglutathione hydrolase [Pseudoalteromonas luteoviolacea]|uniref:S-formylglutathione hydrolase n=1 Tax=Pseudoalteromonas luteoviolacea TaxID=43657 RepID=A0A1C0TVG9_9GAMM|nr:S-formylglutathione hydrolase [Pseudoalteromonas luteoviolacea]OCQ23317.1 S-formylglutathione hydrolase [Pseudoalteromonas luteoviolacea]
MELISENKVFGGWHKRYKHASTVNNCEMTFAVYMPEQVKNGAKVPTLYWLSGLTCTDENFMQKAAAFKYASQHGIAIIAPDTSPRGENVADDASGAYDFGLGAGFYVNATQEPFSRHYNMYDYITKELPELIEAHFPVNDKKSIFGHSMGGHGALVIGLRNSLEYESISAFAPIVNPVNCPWGQKAFSGYLGDDVSIWNQYDATELMQASCYDIKRPIKIDQGNADQFLTSQLKPENFIQAATANNFEIEYQSHDGYDHSYFFISTFVEQHINFHAKYLK